jgi:hypothetical protein
MLIRTQHEAACFEYGCDAGSQKGLEPPAAATSLHST